MELNQIPQNPNNWGNVADLLNENSGKIEAETAKLNNATTKFKGYFSTSTALSAKWPSPLVGDTAWVGETYPGVVYRCDVAGTWLATTDVPSVSTVDLSEYYKLSDVLDKLKINVSTAQTLTNIGEMAWNTETETVELKISNEVTMSIGQELFVKAKNTETTSILNGTPVYISGAQGGLKQIKKASNLTDIAEKTIGLATQDITASASGIVTTMGEVHGLNTSAFAEGALIWLGANGALTTTKPVDAPYHIIIGICTRSHATEGSIFVSVKESYRAQIDQLRSDLNEINNEVGRTAISSMYNGGAGLQYITDTIQSPNGVDILISNVDFGATGLLPNTIGIYDSTFHTLNIVNGVAEYVNLNAQSYRLYISPSSGAVGGLISFELLINLNKQVSVNTQKINDIVSSVLYKTAQSLTFDQKKQSRINIGAANSSNIGLVYCSTDANVSTKVVDISDFFIETNKTLGLRLVVYMVNANTADNVSLSINGFTKPFFYNGAQASSANTWSPYTMIDVILDSPSRYWGISHASLKQEIGTDSRATMSQKAINNYVLAKNQGIENQGKILTVGPDGLVTCSNQQVDTSALLPKYQGCSNEGKVMTVGADGLLYPAEDNSVDSVRVTESITLRLGGNIATFDGSLFDSAYWEVSNGIITYKGGGSVATPFTFSAETVLGKSYLAQITVADITGTNPYDDLFFIQIGNGQMVDTYNGSSSTSGGIKSDGGAFKIIPGNRPFSITSISLQQAFVPLEETHEYKTLEVLNVDSGNSINTNVYGKWNVAIGPKDLTLPKNIGGSRNVAIAKNALFSFENGIQNIAIGTFSMAGVAFGNRNISIGADSLIHSKTVNDNTVIGRGAMEGNTTIPIEKNVAIGNGSMANVSDDNIPYEAVSVGFNSGLSSPKKGVCLGAYSGMYDRDTYNINIGYRSQENSNVSGDGNVFVGAYSGANGSGVIAYSNAIGYKARAEKRQQTVIGNNDSQWTRTIEALIYGDLIVNGSDGVSRKLIFNSDGTISWINI